MADWTRLRARLASVKSSVTLPWDEIDELVGRLPASASQHRAFWSGVRTQWSGFTTSSVVVGRSVTFVRNGHQPAGGRVGFSATVTSSAETVRAKERTSAARPAAPAAGAVDLILVGCVMQKLPVPAPAKDLYTSPLFRKARAYAEATGVPWYVLSAEHGLVMPEQLLAPYNRRLSAMSAAYRSAWGVRVCDELRAEIGLLDRRTIEVHAGASYADSIRPRLTAAGATVVEPLAGLTIGRRLQWYGAHDGVSAPPILTEPGVRELVDRLTNSQHAQEPAAFLATGGRGSLSAGLYSWWVDARGSVDLSRGLGFPVSPGLIYAGLAGATRSRSGRESQNTLWGRIKSMHLGGRHEFSTLRLSLGSVLAESAGAAEIDEVELTAWMHAHLRLITVPYADRDALATVETAVLSQLDPPLNLGKVGPNPLRTRLSALRKKFGRQ